MTTYTFMTGLRNHSGSNAKSLAETTYQRLRAAIVECRLAPGENLTESSISQQLEVGKTPAREALRRLVMEGLVGVTPRHGYTVAPITLRDVQELFQLRLVVEPAAAAMAAKNFEPASLARIRKLSQVGYGAGGRDALRRFVRANTELHTQIAQLSQNRRIGQLVSQLLSESERLINFGVLWQPQSNRTVDEHQRLLEALADRDADSARAIADEHIQATREMVMGSLISHNQLREAPISNQRGRL